MTPAVRNTLTVLAAALLIAAFLAQGWLFINANSQTFDEAVHLTAGYSYLATGDFPFVRYRTAWALGNLLEYPVWLVAGFLVPLALLPGWVRPFSWVLAPTWGVDAIREAATGGGPWPEIGLALGLGAIYLAIGVAVLETVLTGARRAGTVALA